jgi:hypothetical protein
MEHDPTAIVSTSSTHPPNNTPSTFLALENSRERSSGNHHRLVLYLRRTRGELFTIPWPLVTRSSFFSFFLGGGGSGLVLSSARWQLASGLAGLIIWPLKRQQGEDSSTRSKKP